MLEIDDVLHAVLSDHPKNNLIIERIRERCLLHGIEPCKMVQFAMAAWYRSACAILHRDHNQGCPPSELRDFLDPEEPFLNWSYSYASEQHRIANLGVMSTMAISDFWVTPRNPKLFRAALLSNAATTVLFATFLIVPLIRLPGWDSFEQPALGHEGIVMLLKTAWRLNREGLSKSQCAPGLEFGATREEVKMSPDGKELLTCIGSGKWHTAPYWHPFRVTLGSPWGKFIHNLQQTTFLPQRQTWGRIQYRLPSSALSLVRGYEAYFSDLKSKFAQVS